MRHEKRNNIQTVTYVKYVEIIYGDDVIKIDAGKVIMVSFRIKYNILCLVSGLKYGLIAPQLYE